MDGQGSEELPVYKTPIENLDIVPARISLAKLESKLVGDFDAPFRLKDRMEPLRKTYKTIIIDTPPTLGLITVNALVASTHVLIPIQSSYFALEGTDDLLETIEKVKARPNPKLEMLGVLVTLHDKRTTLGKEVFEQIRRVFGSRLFDTVITKSVRLEESPAAGPSLQPRSKAKDSDGNRRGPGGTPRRSKAAQASAAAPASRDAPPGAGSSERPRTWPRPVPHA